MRHTIGTILRNLADKIDPPPPTPTWTVTYPPTVTGNDALVQWALLNSQTDRRYLH